MLLYYQNTVIFLMNYGYGILSTIMIYYTIIGLLVVLCNPIQNLKKYDGLWL